MTGRTVTYVAMALCAIILVLLLTGCTARTQAIVDSARGQGEQIADAALAGAIWGLCYPQTVGAWVREFGHDPGRANAWRELCYPNILELPTEP